MRDNPRTTVISAVAGVVLLAGVFAFTVLVPKLGDDDAEATYVGSAEPASGPVATADGPVTLPDKIGDQLVAVDLGTLPADLAQRFGDLGALKKQEAAITDGLDDVFDAQGAFRVYAAADGSAIAQVTALDKAPGLFAPDALPVAPSAIGVTRAASELVKVDDAVCSVSWPAEVPKGTAVDPKVQPQGVRCQMGVGERTYELTSQGLTVKESVANLEALASA
ncbi:hypothetical protein [Nocardioides plantarum]|uniref:Secreted protein n=1 Tax=Nocardioides plantarum TaxID=29299 RepID=A0ABV5KAR5_9ACTN|nr:hypothetical protein [Nocardioides plantarum]